MTTKQKPQDFISPVHPLLGMFVLTFDENETLEYQGEVIGVDGNIVLVQLYSAFNGDATRVCGYEKAFIYGSRCRLFAPNCKDVWHANYDKFAKIMLNKMHDDAEGGRHVLQTVIDG